jgi:hypothetical protein
MRWRRIGGVEVQLHSFWNSALDVGELILNFGGFIPCKKKNFIHSIGRWAGHRSDLDILE